MVAKNMTVEIGFFTQHESLVSEENFPTFCIFCQFIST